MAFNGTGTFLRIYNWVTDKINSVPITASRMDTEMDGFATGLSNCITKDGQTTVTANIPMNSHKFTGLAVGSARTDSIALGQVQDGTYTYMGTTGGSADAYTLNPSPAITAYVATMQYTAKIAATNLTTTPYLQISGIGTPASDAVIKKLDASKSEIAVEIGDMLANGIYTWQRNSANTAWILLNPEKSYDKYLILDANAINNLGLAASVSSNALTIALKTKAGTDPSATDPVKISFRNSTLTTGTYNTRSATSATSIVISSGSTLGTTNAISSTVYVYALDNSGTIELGVSLAKFADNTIQSSTAEGGAGGADSATVLYSTTARSNVPIRLIGTVSSTQTSAGSWAASPSEISIASIIQSASFLGGLVNSTSGTSIDIVNIPSWATKITVMLIDVSTNSTSPLLLQLGNSGGILTTGYTGHYTDFTPTRGILSSGFIVTATQVAAGTYHAIINLYKFSSGNVWISEIHGIRNDSSGAASNTICCGAKDVTSSLDRVRLTTVGGAATFDNGTINIQYS